MAMAETAEKTNIDVVCAGIIVADVFLPPIDRLPDEGELIKIDEPAHQVGGCASNTAIALSKLGKKAGIVGMVGSDSIGEQLIELLKNERIIPTQSLKPKKHQRRKQLSSQSKTKIEDIFTILERILK